MIPIAIGFDQREAISYHVFCQSILEKSSQPVAFTPLVLALRDDQYAVMVAPHDYKTKYQRKYLGNVNQDYPRKNWSSLILWNCAHPKNRSLTPRFVSEQSGAFLHRFSWLENEDIGRLPLEWNWLTTEYPDNVEAHLLHYTLGSPCFKDYAKAAMSSIWHSTHRRSQQGLGDS